MMAFSNVSQWDGAILLHFSNTHDGAEAQFVQCSIAQFESTVAERIISAPGSQGHSRIFPVINRGFSCLHKSIKTTSENCPQMDSLPASPSPMLQAKRDLTINCAST